MKDADAQKELVATALDAIANDEKLQELSNQIGKMALPDSASVIAHYVLDLIKKNEK